MKNLLLPFLVLYALSPTQATANSGCGPLEEIIENNANKWLNDSFSVTEQVEKFWEIHQRFGFVRKNEQILLVAKSDVLAQQIIGDLKYFGQNLRATKSDPAPINDAVAYDVTEMLPQMLRHLHAREVKYDGPNCWNFCLRGLVTEGAMAMSAQEFSHWLNSPLAREIKSFSDLKPGDIIVFRKNIAPDRAADKAEVHGATYLSPRLALAKSAAGHYYPHRILDLNEALSYYYPEKSDYVRVYRMQSLLETAANLNAPSAVELQQLLRKALDLEKGLDNIAMGFNANGQRMDIKERFKIEDQLEALASELRFAAQNQINRIAATPQKSENTAIELALWEGLLFKANNYDKLALMME